MGVGIGLQPSESTDNLRDHTKKNGSLLQQPTGASPPKALLTPMLVLWTGFIFCRPPQALSLCCKSHVRSTALTARQHSQRSSLFSWLLVFLPHLPWCSLRLRGHGSVIYVPFRVPDLNLMQQLGDLVRSVFWKCSFRLQTDKVKRSPFTDTKVQFYLLIILTYMFFKKYYLGTIWLLLRELIHFTYTLSIYGSLDTIFEKLAS